MGDRQSPQITGEIDVERPIDEVFAFVADLRNQPLYNWRTVRAIKLSAGAVGRGTQFELTLDDGHRSVTARAEHCIHERPTGLTSTVVTATTKRHTVLTLESVGTMTQLRWTTRVEFRGIARLAAPFTVMLLRRQEWESWARLKAVLEHD